MVYLLAPAIKPENKLHRLIYLTPDYKPKETDLEKRRLEYCDDTSFDDVSVIPI